MVNIKRKISFYLLFAMLFILVLNPMLSKASKTRIFDQAGLFNEKEIFDLESQAETISNSYNMDIVIVTTDDAEGKTSRDYADDYYDDNGFGRGNNLDGILFLIDMDNREPYISTSGMGIKYLTDQRIENMINSVFDNGLVDGDYYRASRTFLTDLRGYLQSGIPSGQYSEDEAVKEENSLTLLEGMISLATGGLASAGFFFRTKSKYKMKNPVKPLTFRNNSVVSLVAENDRLLDTITSHRIIQKASNDSGKSTTHESSSGKTHGGGGSKGRKF